MLSIWQCTQYGKYEEMQPMVLDLKMLRINLRKIYRFKHYILKIFIFKVEQKLIIYNNLLCFMKFYINTPHLDVLVLFKQGFKISSSETSI